ncbi:hypothetical protein COCNU_contig68956062G000010 [Cocos nucifera]|nr:hypothetical protein [Cocos nucifera]
MRQRFRTHRLVAEVSAGKRKSVRDTIPIRHWWRRWARGKRPRCPPARMPEGLDDWRPPEPGPGRRSSSSSSTWTSC